MNTKLVNSLVQIIQSLTPEERALLEERLQSKKNWQQEYQKLLEVRAKIFARRKGKPLEPTPEEIIH